MGDRYRAGDAAAVTPWSVSRSPNTKHGSIDSGTVIIGAATSDWLWGVGEVGSVVALLLLLQREGRGIQNNGICQ